MGHLRTLDKHVSWWKAKKWVSQFKEKVIKTTEETFSEIEKVVSLNFQFWVCRTVGRLTVVNTNKSKYQHKSPKLQQQLSY